MLSFVYGYGINDVEPGAKTPLTKGLSFNRRLIKVTGKVLIFVCHLVK